MYSIFKRTVETLSYFKLLSILVSIIRYYSLTILRHTKIIVLCEKLRITRTYRNLWINDH